MAASSMDGTLCDLEDLALAFAQNIYHQTATSSQKKIKADSLAFNINWSRVVFDHAAPEFSNVDMMTIPNSSTLFKTSFSNTTDREQTYSFRTDRSTRSTCDVSMDSTFTKGGEVSVGFKLPGEVLSANAGYHSELSLQKHRGQSFEEELTWGVDSQIQVARRSRATAEIRVTEEKYCSKFSVETRCYGRVRVTVTNMEDNNSLVKHLDLDISRIVAKQVAGKPDVRVCDTTGHVIFVSRGQCQFRFGVEQNVHIKQEALPDADLNAEALADEECR